MGEQNNQPIFTIEKLYVKDLSLEVPGAPQIYRQREAPQVDVSMNNASKRIEDGHYEVVINITISAKLKEKTVFLVEAAYGGVFQIRNVPDRLHRRLKARAAMAGMSLSSYLLGELRGVADRPTVRDWDGLAGDALDDALNAFAWELGGSDDIHASARYRRDMVRTLGRQVIEEARAACRS